MTKSDAPEERSPKGEVKPTQLAKLGLRMLKLPSAITLNQAIACHSGSNLVVLGMAFSRSRSAFGRADGRFAKWKGSTLLRRGG